MDYNHVIEVNNLTESYSTGQVARQAAGSVMMRVNDTVMLATVAYDPDNPVEEDFLPLTVQYIEKSYAAGKIPGGFVKRETKPGDFETLTARIVDRSLRPLFPKGYNYPTVINVLVFSADEKTDLQVMALNAASNALYMTDLAIKKPVGAVRVGRIDGEFVLNPSLPDIADSTLDLFVAGCHEDILMIEMRSKGSKKMIESDATYQMPIEMGTISPVTQIHCANELEEAEMIEALEFALSGIRNVSKTYEETFSEVAPTAREIRFEQSAINPGITEHAKNAYADVIRDVVTSMAKSERMSGLKAIAKTIAENEASRMNGWDEKSVLNAILAIKKQIVRDLILNEGKRVDGRSLDEVRPIRIETNILPSAHASALFTRGETQALVVSTIGGDMDAQMFDLLTDKGPKKERLMVHYNFPGFSVGEAETIGPPARRELGHGNLAKRALEPVLTHPDAQTVRLVSEILESNGSSSMATVCGGALALKASDLDMTGLVAGVAMGLIVENDRHAILSDIMGLEDHDGDMDCKIAGTREGITAMQMDIKLGGLDFEVLKKTLMQAKDARNHILEIMEEAADRIVLNENALPSTNIFHINPGKIVDVIGQAGKTIKEIIEQFEVAIDLNKTNGEVKVSGSSKERVNAASDHIRKIGEGPVSGRDGGRERERGIRDPDDMTKHYNVDEEYDVEVRRTVDFGAFCGLPKGGDGLIHISKLAQGHVDKTTDVVNIGDKVRVRILAVARKKVELILIEKL